MLRLSTLSPEPGSRPACGAALAGALAAVSFSLHVLDPWLNHFDQPGWPYAAYAVLRICLLPLLAAMIYGAGRLVLPGPPGMTGPALGRFAHFLACAAAGVSLISIAYSAMGMATLYYYPLFLCLGLALSFWSGLVLHETAIPLRRWISAQLQILRAEPLGADSVSAVLLTALSLIILVYFGIAEVLSLPLANNDIPGSYLPYQEEILRSTHGFWPTMRFPMFSVLKGAGWNFFVTGLSDHLSSPPANFVLFALLLGLTAQIGAWVCGSLRLAWFGVMLLCLWPMGISYELSLFKTHVAISALLVGAMYWTVLYLTGSALREPAPLRGLVLTIAAVILLYPSNLFLVVLLLLGPAWVYARSRRLDCVAPAYLKIGAAIVMILALTLSYGYTMRGHWDLTYEALDAFVNVETFSKWGSLFILKLQRQLQGEFLLMPPSLDRIITNSKLMLDGSTLYWRPLAIVILLSGMVLWSTLRPSSSPFPRPPQYAPAAFLLLSGFAASTGLVIFVEHVSVIRTANFRFAYAILAVLWMCGWSASRFGRNDKQRNLIAASALLILAAPLPHLPDATARDLRFLAGRESFLSMIEYQWPGVTAYWQSYQKAALGRRIYMLNWEPGVFMLPGAPFERPFQNHALPELPILMYESPEQGRDVLMRAGIDVISVNLRAPLIFTVLSPLFHPDSAAKNFRLLSHLETKNSDLYLLSLRPDEGDALPPRFLEAYARHFEQGRLADHGFNRLYATGECLWRLAKQPGADVGGPQNFRASVEQRRQCARDTTP